MNPNLSIPRERLASFCREHGIKKPAVFGSALGDALGPESDVDLLVEFEPDQLPSLLGIAHMERESSPLFDGRKADLRTPQDLSRDFRRVVIRKAEVQYARG